MILSLYDWMDELHCTTFSTIFQSYPDDGKMIMEGYVQRNSVYV